MMIQNFDPTSFEPIFADFEPVRKNLIPILQAVQDKFGYIPPQSIRSIAKYIGVFPSEISGIITFYSQFYTTPRGRNIIRVCRGTACHVRGARMVLQMAMKHTGLKESETSEDMKFSLETVACLGACAMGPVMVVNKTYYGKLNPGRIEAVLKKLS